MNTSKIKLSKKELNVLELFRDGYKSVAIARMVKTKKGSPTDQKTISTYKNRIKAKLGLVRSNNDYLMVQTAIDKEII